MCKFSRPDTLDPALVVQSIAYQMAQHPQLSSYCDRLLTALEQPQALPTNAKELWNHLIADPLSLCLADLGELPSRLVIMIDALDESVKAKSATLDLIEIVAQCMKDLPPCFRLLVTSRPEDAIVGRLSHYNPVQMKCDSVASKRDVTSFVRAVLQPRVDPSILDEAVQIVHNKCEVTHTHTHTLAHTCLIYTNIYCIYLFI